MVVNKNSGAPKDERQGRLVERKRMVFAFASQTKVQARIVPTTKARDRTRKEPFRVFLLLPSPPPSHCVAVDEAVSLTPCHHRRCRKAGGELDHVRVCIALGRNCQAAWEVWHYNEPQPRIGG